MKAVLFIGDNVGSAEFDTRISLSGRNIAKKVELVPLKAGPLRRHLSYFKLALWARNHRNEFEYVFFWQQFIAIYYVIISILLFSRVIDFSVYYIIFKPPKIHYIGRLKIFCFILMINRASIVYFMTASDILYPLCPAASRKLENNIFAGYECRYGDSSIGDYFFAGGTSNRDYAQLFDAAITSPSCRFVIACLESDIAGLGNPPSNITIEYDCYGDEFDKLVLSCRAIILPLKFDNVMSGQLVAIKAMAAGKITFISSNRFMDDWIPSHISSNWIFHYDSVSFLVSMLESLTSSDFDLARQSSQSFYDEFVSESSFFGRLADDVVRKLG